MRIQGPDGAPYELTIERAPSKILELLDICTKLDEGYDDEGLTEGVYNVDCEKLKELLATDEIQALQAASSLPIPTLEEISDELVKWYRDQIVMPGSDCDQLSLLAGCILGSTKDVIGPKLSPIIGMTLGCVLRGILNKRGFRVKVVKIL